MFKQWTSQSGITFHQTSPFLLSAGLHTAVCDFLTKGWRGVGGHRQLTHRSGAAARFGAHLHSRLQEERCAQCLSHPRKQFFHSTRVWFKRLSPLSRLCYSVGFSDSELGARQLRRKGEFIANRLFETSETEGLFCTLVNDNLRHQWRLWIYWQKIWMALLN